MENTYLPPKRRSINSPSAAPPPSPIPTARGFRSAADPILSEYVDNSIQIPELKLPKHVHRFKPDEIDYRSILLRETDSVRKLLNSIREFGVVQINNHGIVTEELRLALGNGDRIFGLMVECCTSYGDHEKIDWRGDDIRISEEAAAAIGERNYMNFRQKLENAAKHLGAIGRELGMVFAQNGSVEYDVVVPMELTEPTLSICRYHRANIIDRGSPAFRETNREPTPFALCIHLPLEPSRFCLRSGWGDLSFDVDDDAVVVEIGVELQEVRHVGSFTFLHTSKPSFSLQQKWSLSTENIAVDGVVSVWAQILILLLLGSLLNLLR